MENQEEGKCPKCGAELDYGSGEIQDDQFAYDVTCTDCEWAGKEWYTLQFEEQTDSD